MKCKILHESKGRMRVHLFMKQMTFHDADATEQLLSSYPGIMGVRVFDQTNDVIIQYSCDRAVLIQYLSKYSLDKALKTETMAVHSGRALDRKYESKFITLVTKRFVNQLLIPKPLKLVIAFCKGVKYFHKGLQSLKKEKLEVAVLDAIAVGVSLCRRDYKTAGAVMFLLDIGEILEEWTHRKSVQDLANTMSLGVSYVWVRTADGQEVKMPVNQVQRGDVIVVRTSVMIPLDGKVIFGNAMVNQASMTGESVPVHKTAGSYVYAGTVVEEGECSICVVNTAGEGRYDKIVKMIEESEQLKSVAEDKAIHLADKLVPFSLGGTVLTWLLTGNASKALSILMVDFSCALKLAIPISVLSAMRECSHAGITVKGGRFMEAVAEADTIVIDKTGTLTYATPKVAKVIAFDGREEDEMLRIAACLEEHYPHSFANAIVQAAEEKGLIHEEFHTKVEYVVAHGISSMVDGEKVLIGSRHFVLEDEGCLKPKDKKFSRLPDKYSHLYLAIGGKVAAVICIADPIRPEVKEVFSKLRQKGIKKIVMMTGDNEKTAKLVAEQIGVDNYFAEVLPEDKAEFIRKEQEIGHKVIMVGDGINDSPALSEASVGIAISTGATIACEIADITISTENLYALVELKRLSNALMKRITKNYYSIIWGNGLLIGLGVVGWISPSLSALLHNLSTLALGLNSMTDLE